MMNQDTNSAVGDSGAAGSARSEHASGRQDDKNVSGGRSSWFQPLRLNKRAYLLVIAMFTLVGIAGGYAYYALVGCKSGGCAITSNPTLSIIWGGLMGYLIPDFFVKEK